MFFCKISSEHNDIIIAQESLQVDVKRYKWRFLANHKDQRHKNDWERELDNINRIHVKAF
jgi:hypothetical protein